MSTDYTFIVFYGAVIDQHSPNYDVIDDIISRHGGTPAPTTSAGVELFELGSFSCGPVWIAVCATGSAVCLDKDDADKPPERLVAEPEWEERLRHFFERELVDKNMPVVGWHFGVSAV